MPEQKGAFAISLDFELYWGVRDKRSIQQYKNNLQGVHEAIPQLLHLFEKYNIHATWAIVGFLFYKNIKELKIDIPNSLPNYLNEKLSPYKQMNQLSMIDPDFLFASELINQIIALPGQEIGSHTFSHYYCLESGQSIDDFYEDLIASKKIAARNNIEIKSLVFPRNQWNSKYLSVLNMLNIKCFRGNEIGWMYRASKDESQHNFKRAFRLLDAYFNISGHNVYNFEECIKEKPYNFPSSRYLRPYSKSLSFFDKWKLNRIKRSMTYAAKNNRIFHLWWHPHNFGVNIDENIKFLSQIILHFQVLKDKYGMESLNMGELSDFADGD